MCSANVFESEEISEDDDESHEDEDLDNFRDDVDEYLEDDDADEYLEDVDTDEYLEDDDVDEDLKGDVDDVDLASEKRNTSERRESSWPYLSSRCMPLSSHQRSVAVSRGWLLLDTMFSTW